MLYTGIYNTQKCIVVCVYMYMYMLIYIVGLIDMRRLRREACKRSTPPGRLHVKCEMKSIECVNKRVTFKRWVVCTMYYVTRVSLCPFQAESSRGSDVSTHDRGGTKWRWRR